MKCLIIENNKAFYKIEDKDEKRSISEINRDELLKMIQTMVDVDCELDEYDEKLIANPAERVIYKNLYLKLEDLKRKKQRFSDNKSNLYKAAIEKYTLTLENSDSD